MLDVWGDSPEKRRLYAQSSLVIDATELVAEAMEERGWTYQRLATALGVRKSEVRRRLQGRRLTVRQVADMLHVMGYDVRIAKVVREDGVRA